MRRTTLCSFLILVALSVAAQSPARPGDVADASIGVIVYAEGHEITILRGGRRTVLDAAYGEPLGEPLLPGDQVTTGQSTYAEIQLLTSRNIVKIAENTTFTVSSLTTDGDSALAVTYGRIRARVDRLTGNDRFEIRGLASVAGVRGTDFGYDQVLDPVSGELVHRVYCFEGEVTVTQTVGPLQETTVRGGEMIVGTIETDAPVETEADTVPVVQVVALAEPVTSFWDARAFVREPVEVEELIREFPGLPSRTTDELGVVAPVLETAVADAARPSVDVESAREQEEVVTVQEVEPEQEPRGLAEVILGEDDTPELRDQIAGGLRTTGYWLTGVGVLTDFVVVGLVFFGDQIPGWDPGYNAYLGPVGAGGVAVVAIGAASIVLSLAFSN